MSAELLLSVGDGVTSDYLDLNDGDTYGVMSIDYGIYSERRVTGEAPRQISITEEIYGESGNALWANVRAIEAKINQARAGWIVSGGQSGVTLGSRLAGADEYVYADLRGGQVIMPPGVLLGPALEVNWLQGVQIILDCEAAFRGDEITDSAATWTGGAPVSFRASVPGDLPAGIKFEVTDNSTNSQVLNRLRVGAYSRADLDDGDFDGVYNCADGADASSHGDTDSVDGTNVSQVASPTANTWHEIAVATAPSPLADNAGLFDIYARVKTQNANLGKPTIDSVTPVFGGSLQVGIYDYIIVAYDGAGGTGSNGPPSTVKTQAAGNGYLTNEIAYSAPATGPTPASYRIYWRYNGGSWSYVTDTAPDYTFSAESGSAGDPPSSSSNSDPTFRSRLGLASGTTLLTFPEIVPVLGDSNWEIIKLASGIHLPPMAFEEGGSAQGWDIYIDGNPQDGTATVEADAVWLIPADMPQIVAEYRGLDLGTTRKWIFGTNRHGRNFGWLANKSGGAEIGQLDVRGLSRFGPGDTQFVVLPEVEGGVSRVSDVSLSAVLKITPYYRFVTGVV